VEALRQDLSSCPTRVQAFGTSVVTGRLQCLSVIKTCPTLPMHPVLMIDCFSAAVESRGQFVAQGRSAGNENRRWHGTRRECNLGDKGNTTFCGSSTCSLCCIVKTSFDLSLWGKKTGWGRYEILSPCLDISESYIPLHKGLAREFIPPQLRRSKR
jgi:hypothetical protein